MQNKCGCQAIANFQNIHVLVHNTYLKILTQFDFYRYFVIRDNVFYEK